MYYTTAMRLALALVLALAATGHADAPRAPHAEAAPKTELERKAPAGKPVDGASLCTYVNADQNAPSERRDCIAGREPEPQRPVEKTPPHGPNDDAVASRR